ncbi:MAG: hypothetical protein JNM69_38810 [Archangium sp.]|nr:hypothetical protein [Archangium sp.]
MNMVCLKRCFAPGDCARGQFCHRLRDSEVSACVSSDPFQVSVWKPDDRRYWSPTYRWLEPYRSEAPTPAQRVKEAFGGR